MVYTSLYRSYTTFYALKEKRVEGFNHGFIELGLDNIGTPQLSLVLQRKLVESQLQTREKAHYFLHFSFRESPLHEVSFLVCLCFHLTVTL